MDHIEPTPPGIGALFTGFLTCGMMAFGGVLPWARRMIVEQRGWLSGPEFTELLALCQFVPGPNVVNLSVAVGARFHGVPGAFAALAGLIAAPVAFAVALCAAYGRLEHIPAMQHAFAGLASASAGLVIATAWRIARPLAAQRRARGIALLTFVLVALVRLPLLPTMLALAPLSIGLMWRIPE